MTHIHALADAAASFTGSQTSALLLAGRAGHNAAEVVQRLGVSPRSLYQPHFIEAASRPVRVASGYFGLNRSARASVRQRQLVIRELVV